MALKMSLEEVIQSINSKQLNNKTNNCIIHDLDGNSRRYLLKHVQPQSSIINDGPIEEEGHIIDRLTNIIVDLNNIEYFNILNIALSQLQIDEKIRLQSLRDLMKFKSLLLHRRHAIQFIITNPGMLDETEARIFNLLLWINSFAFNSIILLNQKEHLSSYQIPNGSFLDNREDYMDIQLVKSYGTLD